MEGVEVIGGGLMRGEIALLTDEISHYIIPLSIDKTHKKIQKNRREEMENKEELTSVEEKVTAAEGQETTVEPAPEVQAPAAEVQTAAPEVQAPAAEAQAPAAAAPQKNGFFVNLVAGIITAFTPKKRKKTIAILAAAVVVIVAVILLLTAGSAKSVAQRFVKSYCSGNVKAGMNLLAYDHEAYMLDDYDDEEEFFESISNWTDSDISSWSDYYKVLEDEAKEDLEDSYGKYRVSAEATKEKNMSLKKWEDEYDWEIENYEDAGCFDRDSVKAVKIVTVKVKIQGEDDIERDSGEICMVKMGLFWKVFDYDL